MLVVYSCLDVDDDDDDDVVVTVVFSVAKLSKDKVCIFSHASNTKTIFNS